MPLLGVGDSRQLTAAVLAFKAADRDLQKLIRATFREHAAPLWQAEIARRASGDLERVVYGTAKPAASGGNPPELRAATSRRRRSGGLIPAEHYGGIEFGSKGDRVTRYTRRNRSGSGSHKVERHTTRQLPTFRRGGRVAWAAIPGAMIPKLTAVWITAIVDAYAAAADNPGG